MIATLTSLTRAYTFLRVRDHNYAANPTIANHCAILRAQRVYYRRLLAYNRATLPPDEARVRCAKQLLARAAANKRRLPTNAAWQALTLHQWRRARTLVMRAEALLDYNTPPPPTQPHTLATTKRLPRVPHPVTGRAHYYDAATDTYYRQHPATP